MQRQHVRTPGQERRRTERIARRAARANTASTLFVSSPQPRQHRTFAMWRAIRKQGRESAAKFMAMVLRNHDIRAIRLSRTPRCTYMRVYERDNREVYGDPCGGKLRRVKVKDDVPTFECRTCGRRYFHVETEQMQAAV